MDPEVEDEDNIDPPVPGPVMDGAVEEAKVEEELTLQSAEETIQAVEAQMLTISRGFRLANFSRGQCIPQLVDMEEQITTAKAMLIFLPKSARITAMLGAANKVALKLTSVRELC